MPPSSPLTPLAGLGWSQGSAPSPPYCLDKRLKGNVLPLPPSVQDGAELQGAQRPHQTLLTWLGQRGTKPDWNGLFPPLVTRP